MMLRTDLNMKRVSDIMRPYFEDAPMEKASVLAEARLPVNPKASSWEYIKEPYPCLYAKFTFESADTYSYFLSEIADLEKRMGHHGKIECEYPDIAISVCTHTLGMVTKQDVKYAEKALQIFKDAEKLEESK